MGGKNPAYMYSVQKLLHRIQSADSQVKFGDISQGG